VKVVLQRQVEAINRVRTGREGKKKRDLEAIYAPEKVKTLTDALRAKGMWYWDPDFVGDEEDPGAQLYEMIFFCYDSMFLPNHIYLYWC